MLLCHFQIYRSQHNMPVLSMYLRNEKWMYPEEWHVPGLPHNIQIGNMENPLPYFLAIYFLEKSPGIFFSIDIITCMIFDSNAKNHNSGSYDYKKKTKLEYRDIRASLSILVCLLHFKAYLIIVMIEHKLLDMDFQNFSNIYYNKTNKNTTECMQISFLQSSALASVFYYFLS